MKITSVTKVTFLATFTFISCFSGTGFGQAPTDEFNKTIEKIYAQCNTIKPGVSTRRDLLKIFKYQGGIASPEAASFEYRGCPFIHVKVEFKLSKPTDDPKDDRGWSFSDIISKISQAYISTPVWD